MLNKTKVAHNPNSAMANPLAAYNKSREIWSIT